MMYRGQQAFLNSNCNLNKRPPAGSYLQMLLMLILVYAVITIKCAMNLVAPTCTHQLSDSKETLYLL